MANARNPSTSTPKAAKAATGTPPKAAKAATGTPPKAAKGSTPKAATGTPATPPAGGYTLLRAACPARPGSNRADRWPLLVASAGKPGGVAALADALKKGGHWATAKGMLAWCQRKGWVDVDPAMLPKGGAAE